MPRSHNLISVITPVYATHREYVEIAASSIVPQLGDGVEWIIVDDGSPPEYRAWLSETVLRFSPSAPVHLIDCDGHHGMAHTRNVAVAASQAEWILLLDSDDFLSPDAIAVLRTAADDPCADMIYTDHAVASSEGETLFVRRKRRYHELHQAYKGTPYDPLLHATYIFHPQMYRRSALLQSEGFVESFGSGDESELQLRVTALRPEVNHVHIPISTYHYRDNPLSVCHDPAYYEGLIRNIGGILARWTAKAGTDVTHAQRLGRAASTHAAHYELLNDKGHRLECPWFDYTALDLVDAAEEA